MEIEDLYPVIVDINEIIGKVRFFINDHWVEIGKIEMVDVVEEGKHFCEVTFPDIDLFMDSRLDLNDGTEDWATWGVRLN